MVGAAVEEGQPPLYEELQMPTDTAQSEKQPQKKGGRYTCDKKLVIIGILLAIIVILVVILAVGFLTRDSADEQDEGKCVQVVTRRQKSNLNYRVRACLPWFRHI